VKIQLIGIAIILLGIAWILINIASPSGDGAMGGFIVAFIGLFVTIGGAFIRDKK